MSSAPLIRLANTNDAAAIGSIYAPFVRDTPISFELEPPSVEEMQRRIENTLHQFPWLVCEVGGEITGYAYAGSHSERAAYLWSVNVSVYIHPCYHRCGIGRALYASLFEILRLQGFHNAYAGVTLPNPASVSLHEAIGFRPVGIYDAVGYKSGRWHSVGWWQFLLQDRSPTPLAPLSVDEVIIDSVWKTAIDTGLPFLKF